MKEIKTDAKFHNIHPSVLGEMPRCLNGGGVFYGVDTPIKKHNNVPKKPKAWAIIALLFGLCLTIQAQENWTDNSLPLADADKQLYQWTGYPPPGGLWLGGRCRTVRITSVDELKQQLEYDYQRKLNEINLSEIRTGSRFFWGGILFSIICVVVHCLTSLPQIQRMLEWGMIGGGAASAAGLLIKKVSEYQDWLALAFGLAVLGTIAYKVRGFSISHKLFKKENREVTDGREQSS